MFCPPKWSIILVLEYILQAASWKWGLNKHTHPDWTHAGAGITHLICAECKSKAKQWVWARSKARSGFNLVIIISSSPVQYALVLYMSELISNHCHVLWLLGVSFFLSKQIFQEEIIWSLLCPVLRWVTSSCTNQSLLSSFLLSTNDITHLLPM